MKHPKDIDADDRMEAAFDDEVMFEPGPGVEAATQVDGFTVRHPDTGAYYSLNGTAGFLWELLRHANTLSTVKEMAAEHYGESRDNTDASIDAFVADLVGEGLLRRKAVLEDADS